MENSQIAAKKHNPLASYFRQPKIYIKLPSRGKFYKENSLDVSETGDYAVFSMTAKDELMMKTPDALMNGQSTVEVIKSCVPAIKDPWAMPSIDLDAILIAVRIATYGENMELTTNCPHCGASNDYEIDLTQWLGIMSAFEYQETISVDPLTIRVRPYSYKEMTEASLKTLEQQKIFQLVNDDTITEEEKIEKFGKSFVKLTELTVDVIAKCIAQIDTPGGSTEDSEQIREFLHNAPKEIFQQVSDHISKMKENIEFPPQNVTCDECKKEFLMPIALDQSNFFAVRS